MHEIKITDSGRGPGIPGTRVTVYDIIPYLEGGDTPPFIADVLSITTEEVLALIQYIEDHKEEVMAVHRKIEERIARGNPPEVEARREEMHAKLLAKMEELRKKRSQGGPNGEGDSGGHQHPAPGANNGPVAGNRSLA
jgi:uncharacterized protein (DUF433 family)